MTFIRKIIRYSVLIGFCYIFVCVCKSLSLLEIINKDWITWLEIENMLFIYLGILVVFYIFFIYTKSELTEIHILIKKHLLMIKLITFCLMTIFFYKSYNTKLMIVFILEFLFMYCLLDYESNKQYTYSFDHTNRISNYTEKTIIGKDKLTDNQRYIYKWIERLISERSSDDSFNIGLIGDWGSGKTSITDTLIYELEKENTYFFLKISALTFNETGNIIEYVKKFFGDLFKRYEIDYYFGESNVAFLGSLAILKNNTKTVKDIVESIEGNNFIDIEKERILFNKQVKRLLEVSKRKNIILMIDDMDRTYQQDNIIKLLSEFSSINGLITIVSLNNDLNKKIVGEVYSEMDKYIHVRFYLEKDNDIYFDKMITKQIISSNDEIKLKDDVYLLIGKTNKTYSLYDTLPLFKYRKVVSQNSIESYDKNLLYEVFLENIKLNDINFGDALENLVNDYFKNSKELTKYTKTNYNNSNDDTVGKIWVEKYKKTYLLTIYVNCKRALFCINTILKILKREKMELHANNFKNIKEMYEYFLNKNNFMITSMEKIVGKNCGYIELTHLKIICFKDDEWSIINELIQNSKYDYVERIFNKKRILLLKLFIFTASMKSFMSYTSLILNNYREFKIQLRESVLLECNYLDYLLKGWRHSKKINEDLKKEDEILGSYDKDELNEIPIEDVLNNMIFMKHITNFGINLQGYDICNSRLYICKIKNKKIIVISHIKDDIRNSVILDCNGNFLKDLTDTEYQILENKNKIIWEYSDND